MCNNKTNAILKGVDTVEINLLKHLYAVKINAGLPNQVLMLKNDKNKSRLGPLPHSAPSWILN